MPDYFVQNPVLRNLRCQREKQQSKIRHWWSPQRYSAISYCGVGEEIRRMGVLGSVAQSAWLGAHLNQPLCHQHHSENLRPFGNDIADDLAPAAAGIHGSECDHPGDACDQKN